MPIYEYRCSACGFQDEYLQRVSDPLLTDCPECRKPTFTKLVSAAGFQLKGTGWYATDFKNKGTKPQVTKSDGEGKAADKGDSGESKAADKPAETKKDDSKAESTGASPVSS